VTIMAQSQVEMPSDARSASPRSPMQDPRRIRRLRIGLAAGMVVALGVALYLGGFWPRPHHDPAAIARELEGLGRPSYQPQKVVYHVDYPAGWRGRTYDDLVGVLENHVKAVGAGRLDLKVVLQGGGADLLLLAKLKPVLARRIDALKAEGVRFLVCKNTLLGRGIDPFADLYGIEPRDVITAAVAELVALEQEGYVYLHL